MILCIAKSVITGDGSLLDPTSTRFSLRCPKFSKSVHVPQLGRLCDSPESNVPGNLWCSNPCSRRILIFTHKQEIKNSDVIVTKEGQLWWFHFGKEATTRLLFQFVPLLNCLFTLIRFSSPRCLAGWEWRDDHDSHDCPGRHRVVLVTSDNKVTKVTVCQDR